MLEFTLDSQRVHAILNVIPLETRQRLGYADRSPSPTDIQLIVNAIADQVVVDRMFREAVVMRLPKRNAP